LLKHVIERRTVGDGFGLLQVELAKWTWEAAACTIGFSCARCRPSRSTRRRSLGTFGGTSLEPGCRGRVHVLAQGRHQFSGV
jgi:hypothetical protein